MVVTYVMWLRSTRSKDRKKENKIKTKSHKHSILAEESANIKSSNPQLGGLFIQGAELFKVQVKAEHGYETINTMLWLYRMMLIIPCNKPCDKHMFCAEQGHREAD